MEILRRLDEWFWIAVDAAMLLFMIAMAGLTVFTIGYLAYLLF